ncbi:polysaccharide synthesis protein exod [Marinicauda salina]|uniref:Polysaccharide synthesis protein exod n=1 Tax=Marinicauda salina TaxID=2135793 RepID=A0A2U2BS70_9PROT|nr:exopolysaccharide biosynthesis protein [Marinicauda salina]PWE16863.1 polysaccharide synthesis protein exod [Marinicauda salina]
MRDDDPADPIDEELVPGRGLVAALEAVRDAAPEEGLRLEDFIEGLGERVFGVVLFALAIPVCIPFLYGVPQVVALPMMALAAQMALGRPEPWLPRRFRDRVIGRPGLERMAAGARKWFGWVERLARPRLTVLSNSHAERVVGAIFILFCASILVPLPATNTTPGIAIALASIGLITRDGLLVLAGLVLGTAWVTLLVVGFAVLGPAFIDVMKDFVSGLIGAMTSS